MRVKKNTILITVDVEDWFQVENFKPWIPYSSWSSHRLRVEQNTYRILDLLDDFKEQIASEQKPSITFFILGWLAKQIPNLIRDIQHRGHEIASHGYHHKLCNSQSFDELKKDLIDSRKLLEDITGAPIKGYRAPSFSIDFDTLKLVEACGYAYDSSFNSFSANKRYGKIDVSRIPKKGIAIQISENFYELPISNVKINRFVLPVGGGGYFRLIPLQMFNLVIESILKKNHAYLFYMHPWEIDPDQPRVKEASTLYKFRHYVNLNRTYSKLSKFLKTFHSCELASCSQYLDNLMRGSRGNQQ